ncbi:MAG TPA: LTA synthase family protein [Cyclobacteriaceae bacterium]
MKQRLTLFGLSGLFWMVYFTFSRILFLIYHHDLASSLSWTDILMVMALGSRMDAAIAADCLILTGLLLTASCVHNWKFIAIANHFVVGTFIVIAAIVVVADLELYRHWGFRMDSTPLMYIGSEGAQSVGLPVWLLLLSLLLLLVVPSGYFYWKKIAPRFAQLPEVKVYNAAIMFVVTALLFIPIRSSFSVAPLNTGVVYFHKTIPFANHAGINVVWNFFESVAEGHKLLYPDNFYDSQKADVILKDITRDNGATKHILKTQKPNILLIVLESFTAKIIEPLGGMPGVTPQLNQLVHDGILFDNFYASGDRTDKGIVAILSGYPAQPKSSIIKFPNKTQSLPFLSRSLQSAGYHTSFVYGGDIGFANMESYVTEAGFANITNDDDFPSSLVNSKWGVHDHYVFNRLLEECDTAQAPFFKVMLSLSSHEPFDVPLDPPYLEGPDERNLFLNACHYTDKSLGEFIAKAKTKGWWNNTWVIITADHGHRYPDSEELADKRRFQVPMLWLGGAVDVSDSVVHIAGGQTDIANTVLSQIDVPSKGFSFGKNMMDKAVTPFAVFIFNNGYGYLDGANENVYDFDLKNYVSKTGNAEDIGKAYMQMLFNDYNSR